MRRKLAVLALSLAACGSCTGTPEVQVHGQTEALSVEDVRWASEEREQLEVDLAYEGGRVHDVIALFYAKDERVAVDGIPGAVFDEPGRVYRRRLPAVTPKRMQGASEIRARISEVTRLELHVNETEKDARRVVEEADLLDR